MLSETLDMRPEVSTFQLKDLSSKYIPLSSVSDIPSLLFYSVISIYFVSATICHI